MFGIEELKDRIEITNTTVECPVKGCDVKVRRQRVVFKREEKFKCQKHNIYISPSTFVYFNELDNVLWQEKDDINLFKRIKNVKRVTGIAHEKSEDAITWNVFRFLDKYNLLESILSSITGYNINELELIFWSYSQFRQYAWDPLLNARIEFGESNNIKNAINEGSEPDLIVKSDKALFFVEAKLTSDNKTPSDKEGIEDKIKNPKKYTTGGNSWFEKVFISDYKTIIHEQKYELMRFWLIGSWIAHNLDLDFYLVNLVLSEREKDIETVFNKHIRNNERRKFIRITWEDIYKRVLNSDISTVDKDVIIRYFKNKAIGYDGNGRLQKAFTIL